jgi:hypothetical protein
MKLPKMLVMAVLTVLPGCGGMALDYSGFSEPASPKMYEASLPDTEATVVLEDAGTGDAAEDVGDGDAAEDVGDGDAADTSDSRIWCTPAEYCTCGFAGAPCCDEGGSGGCNPGLSCISAAGVVVEGGREYRCEKL